MPWFAKPDHLDEKIVQEQFLEIIKWAGEASKSASNVEGGISRY
jgi:hypothetical protein